MCLWVLVQRLEHDGQDLIGIVVDQVHNILVIPVIQGSLSNLPKMQLLKKLDYQSEFLSLQREM